MARLLLALVATLALAGPVAAYTNVNGHEVRSPVHARHAPRGASAQCEDGTYSFSEHHRGTCSHHGGVARWL
jgi:hypothetical protein